LSATSTHTVANLFGVVPETFSTHKSKEDRPSSCVNRKSPLMSFPDGKDEALFSKLKSAPVDPELSPINNFT